MGCYNFKAMNLICHYLLGIVLEIYIDDVVVKSDSMNNHLSDLRLALERMCRYMLKMNQLKCVFDVSVGKFIGFITHEHGIEIDPIKIESINKIWPPQCKNNMQKFLVKLNYFRRFISNLSGKISAFAPILQLKNEAKFTWRADQQCTFDDIKRYLSSPPVMKTHMAEIHFWLYIATKDVVIGAVLTQVIEGKKHIITYLSRCPIDAETRYSFIEKLCLSLFYACSKLQHYLLASNCIVFCQADVIKHMLQ
jgi:hypothetical protein